MEPDIDFAKYYDNHPEYVQLREDEAVHDFRLKIVDNWKIKYLFKVTPKNIRFGNIVEVGCATGELIGRIPFDVAPHNRYGIDISSLNIAKSEKQFPGLNFFAGTFGQFVAGMPSSFEIDLAILSDVLEHVPDDLGLLKSVAERSKHILINLPLEKCREYRNRQYGIDDERGHLRAYNISDAKNLIEKAGLQTNHFAVKYYVKEPIFRSYLWNKLILNTLGVNHLRNYFKYLYEILEITVNYRSYKSNFFAFLKK